MLYVNRLVLITGMINKMRLVSVQIRIKTIGEETIDILRKTSHGCAQRSLQQNYDKDIFLSKAVSRNRSIFITDPKY